MPIKIPADPFGQGGVATAAPMSLHAIPQVANDSVKALRGMSAAFAAATDRYTKQLDDTQSQDAINRMKLEIEDLEANPDTGWAAKTGSLAFEKNAAGEDLPTSTFRVFDERRDEIRKRLTTPRQRKAFDDFVSLSRADVQAKLGRHLQKAAHDRDLQVDADTISELVKELQDPAQRDAAMSALEVRFQAMADKTGKTVDAQKILSPVFTDLIRQSIDNDRFAEADSLRAKYGDYIEQPKLTALASLQKTARERYDKKEAVNAIPRGCGYGRAVKMIAKIPFFKDHPEIADTVLNRELNLEARARSEHARQVASATSSALRLAMEGKEIPESLAKLVRENPESMWRIEDVQYKVANGFGMRNSARAIDEIGKMPVDRFMTCDFKGEYPGLLTQDTIAQYEKARSSLRANNLKVAESTFDRVLSAPDKKVKNGDKAALKVVFRLRFAELAALNRDRGGLVSNDEVMSLANEIADHKDNAKTYLNSWASGIKPEDSLKVLDEQNSDKWTWGGIKRGEGMKGLSDRVSRGSASLASSGYSFGSVSESAAKAHLSMMTIPTGKPGENISAIRDRRAVLSYYENNGDFPADLKAYATAALKKGVPEKNYKSVARPDNEQIDARIYAWLLKDNFNLNQLKKRFGGTE